MDQIDVDIRPNACRGCGDECKSRRHQFCAKCSLVNRLYRRHATGQHEAVVAVNCEIRRKRLVRPASLLCADCGDRASAYDHRDYNKPLEVTPVCQPCNLRRGNAIPKMKSFDEFVAYCLQLPTVAGTLTKEDFYRIKNKFITPTSVDAALTTKSAQRLNPGAKILQQLKIEFGFRNDAEISRFLDVSVSYVAKLRSEIIAVSAELIVGVHTRTGWPIRHIKKLVGQV